MNFFERWFYLFKKYYRYWKNKTYSSFRYSIFVEHIDLKISRFTQLKKIVFDDYFNQELNFEYPPNLKHIVFGKRFNQKIDHLPDSVEKIKFAPRSQFNHNIEKYPNQLKEIIFGRMFHQSIDHLPESVEIINMLYCDDYPLNIRHLPKQLKILNLRGNSIIECAIPKHVEVYIHSSKIYPSML
jgi:hypothetical protein